jgi:hypothetical protein
VTLNFIAARKTRTPRTDRSFAERHVDASEAVRRHLDNVEIGSPLLYPF